MKKDLATEKQMNLIFYISLCVLNEIEDIGNYKTQYNGCLWINSKDIDLNEIKGNGNHSVNVNTIKRLFKAISKLKE
jgi:hypothetical protein